MKDRVYCKVDTKERNEVCDEINMEDCKEVDKPTVFTGFRDSHMTDEEAAGVNHLMDMMIAAKQQIMLRKTLYNE